MTDAKPFIPGFPTQAAARAAGRKFFAKTNGTRGLDNRDFHLVQNDHGRWHFSPGPAPKVPDPA